VEALLWLLHALALPLSSATFKKGMQLLRTDLATHHAIREGRELVQHPNREACKDQRDAPQMFEG
jgi:hypothetical protein